jgi:GxxExxY protein
MKPNEITREIIGGAIEVHRELGPGKPEVAYERALAKELGLRGMVHQVQKPVPVVYKGVRLECGFRLDLLVCDSVGVEIKSVEVVIPVHRAQTLTYLRLGGWKLGLLLNFNVAILKEGIQRLVFGFEQEGQSVQPPIESLPTSEQVVHPLCPANDSGDAEAERSSHEIIASAIEVHRLLGPGLLPSAYEACLCHELRLRGVPFEFKRPLALSYKGTSLTETDTVPLVVGGRVVVSPQCLSEIEPVHEAQLLSQLRLGGWRLGLLLNFGAITLAEGIRRMVWDRASRSKLEVRGR